MSENFNINGLKQELDILYNQFTELYNLTNNKIIESARNEIQTYKEELDKGLFFITIQGNLKTGKSTLINVLARKVVAITKSGIDTTASAYIVTKSLDNENHIIEYYMNSGLEDYEKKEVFQNIINDIKGLSVNDKRFKKRKLEFNLSKIEEFTVNKKHKNTLLINIQIVPEEDGILNQEDIAILDTPGVDGKKADDNIEALNAIMERSNMLIVLQSTITPFNTKQKASLKTFSKTSDVVLIHNRFDLKHWASSEDRNEFYSSQDTAIKNASNDLHEIFGKKFPTHPIDLAKVEAYIYNPVTYKAIKDVFNEYNQFKIFEAEIQDFIKDNRIKIKENNAKSSLEYFFNRHQDENIDNNNHSLYAYRMKIISKNNDIKLEEQQMIELHKSYMACLNDLPRRLKSFIKTKNISNDFKEVIKTNGRIKEAIPKKVSTNVFGLHSVEDDIPAINEAIENLNANIYNNLKQKLYEDIQQEVKEFLQEKHFSLNDEIRKFSSPIPTFELKNLIIPNKLYLDLENKDIKKVLTNNIKESGEFFKRNTDYKAKQISDSIKAKLSSSLDNGTIIEEISNDINDNIQLELNNYIERIDSQNEEDNLLKHFLENYTSENYTTRNKYDEIVKKIDEIFDQFGKIQFIINGVL